MSCSALFAVKRAVEDARKDAGNTDIIAMCRCLDMFLAIINVVPCQAAIYSYPYAAGPATIEKIHTACLVDSANFSL